MHISLPNSSPQVLGTTSKIWSQTLSSEQSCLAVRQLMAALEGPGVTNPEKQVAKVKLHGMQWGISMPTCLF